MAKIKFNDIDACKSGAEYANSFDTERGAWDYCDNIGWLAWYATRKGVAKKHIAVCVAHIANLSRHLMDERSKRAIDEIIFTGSISKEAGISAADAADADAAAAAAADAIAAEATDVATARNEIRKLALMIAKAHLTKRIFGEQNANT